MTEKIVHVDAYTRSDGTYVREHERHIDNNDNVNYYTNESENSLLEGGIELNDYLEDLENIVDTQNNSQKSTDNTVLQGEIKINHYIGTLENDFSKSKAREQELLDELSQTGKGNQADLLDKYIELKNKNDKMQKTLVTLKNLTEYAAEIMKEQGKLFNDFIKNMKNKKMNFNDSVIDAMDNNPKAAQDLMDIGINVLGSFDKNDARQLWNIASHGFDEDNGRSNLRKQQAWAYVNSNGKAYNKINDLPLSNEIKQIVRNKVKQQLGINDIEGFVFHENSSLANKITNSDEFQQACIDYFKKQTNTNTIQTSISYANGDNENLKAAIGKSDIINLHITLDGHLECYVLDTYDFNKNSQDLKVRAGRSVQEHGNLHNYYTLTKIRI